MGDALHWNALGTPKRPHPPCPRCGEDEIGSHFDRAWCHACGWKGAHPVAPIVVDAPRVGPFIRIASQHAPAWMAACARINVAWMGEA